MIPAIIELRQYTLHPGRRDALISLFEREFVESQESEGITLIGLFRDLDDPDRFVWLRGFPDMEARRTSLEAFYSGPAWAANREAANATMIDSDDVLLLKPLQAGPDRVLAEREPPGATVARPGVAVCGVHRVSGPDGAPSDQFLSRLAPRLALAALTPLVALVSEPSPNTFPRLPVREGEQVLVWLALCADEASADRAIRAAKDDPVLKPMFAGALQLMRLAPTARSRLHG